MNQTYRYINAYDLRDAFDEGLLSNELKNISSELNEDAKAIFNKMDEKSNPVLMLIKFK